MHHPVSFFHFNNILEEILRFLHIFVESEDDDNNHIYIFIKKSSGTLPLGYYSCFKCHIYRHKYNITLKLHVGFNICTIIAYLAWVSYFVYNHFGIIIYLSWLKWFYFVRDLLLLCI